MIILKRLSVWAALAGIAFAAWALMGANKIEPMPTPVSEPPRSPYEQTVAASGIIEAVNENVRIAPPAAGLITKMFVGLSAIRCKTRPRSFSSTTGSYGLNC